MTVTTRITVFPTQFGWFALALHGEAIVGLTFGHDSPEPAVAGLRRIVPASFVRPLGLCRPRTDAAEVTELDEHGRRLVKRLQAYAEGARDDFLDVPVWMDDRTPFQRAVLRQCRRISHGQTASYSQLACRAGSPAAARAVGRVMATNRVPIIVPCHRVIGGDGGLGGYSAPSGLAMKRRLLRHEGAFFANCQPMNSY